MTKEESDLKVRCSNATVKDFNQSFSKQLDKACLESWCRLIRDRRWGCSAKYQLLMRFGSAQAVLGADIEVLQSMVQFKSKSSISASLLDQQIMADLHWLEQPGHHLITLDSSSYPRLLREISDPPIALFAIGDLDLINEPQVAIVGSRRPTPVGVQLSRNIAEGLAEVGIVVTSGLALGIDGTAHAACLEQDEPTIAVMGCGLDIIYPARNRGLFDKLKEVGLIVSEYPLGVRPDKYTFPKRNRIVSGLSYGVVIVEAAERSGTIITARLCMEQNRELMVVPGSALSKQYKGSHRLLSDGANLVCNASDVIHQLSLELSSHIKPRVSSSPNQIPSSASASLSIESDMFESTSDKVLAHIGAETTSMDSIISGSGLTAAQVSSILLALELEGAIAIERDGGYVNLT